MFSALFLWPLKADKDQNACLSIEVSHFPCYLSNPALSQSVLTRQGRVGGSSSGYLLWTSNGESILKSACPGMQRVKRKIGSALKENRENLKQLEGWRYRRQNCHGRRMFQVRDLLS